MREDAFAKCHPAVNFLFFMGAIISCLLIQHPVYLCVGVVCAGTYYLLLKGRKGLKNLAGLSPLFVVLTLINPLLNTYGETVLFTYWNRPYTLEALFYGGAIAAIFVEMILWFGCYNVVLTSDKFTALFGNIIPVLSLLLVMVLRMIPNFMKKAAQIEGARRCIGKGVGELDTGRQKLDEGLMVLGTLTSWALEGSIVTADSMRSRGYGSGHHTSFMLYKIKKSDCFLMILEALLLVLMILLGNKEAAFTPVFYIAPVSGTSFLGLIFYALFLMIPVILHIKEAVQWHISISKI